MARRPPPPPRRQPPPPARRPASSTPAPPDRSAAIAASSGGVRERGPKSKKAATGVTDPDDLAKLWSERLIASNKDYKKWSEEYLCPTLDDYYRGRQWQGLGEAERMKRYVINMVFATVETQLPTLLFSRPVVEVEARPSTSDTAGTNAGERADLIKRTLQTFLDDPKIRFTYETTLSLRNAYARFAIVEVGYTADYIENPNADKPILMDDGVTPRLGADKEPLKEPKRIPKAGTETLFVKRLRPQHFRCSGSNRNRLEANDWVAHYEWVYVEDLKKNPQYANTATLKSSGRLVNGPEDVDDAKDEDTQQRAGMCKLWRIWDLRAKVRHAYVEGHDQLVQTGKPFTTLPLAVLKFYELEDSFYPLPPIFNWLSPQDEINETREMQKVHRRRAVRRYMRLPSVDKTEFEKLADAPDMSAIEVPAMDSIKPIEDAPLDRAVTSEELAISKDDLAIITGVSGEARGTAEADTATQANIINTKAALRESSARLLVGAWLAQICRLMLLAIRDNVQGPLMVKRSVDWFAPAPAQAEGAKRANEAWQEIEAEDLDELDVDISIDVTSLSPVAEEQARQNFIAFLTLLTNQAIGIYFFTPNPAAPDKPTPLFRKAAHYFGIKNEREVQEIFRVGILVMANQAAAAQAQLAAQRDKPHATWSFKGEDMADPLVLAAFVKAEGLQAEAAAIALRKQNAPPMGGGAAAMPELATSGQPSGAAGQPSATQPAAGG